jgi:NTE family protein
MIRKPRIGIVLGGTAPAMTLMAGAMRAFAERRIEFDAISTTGVGALVGLLYVAPRLGDRERALRDLPNLFVSDWLYRLVPFNFKVFHKYHPLAGEFWKVRKALATLKFPVPPQDPSPLRRLVNDWVDLWATALTPMTFEFLSNGVLSHVPLVEDLVDFDTLARASTRVYVSAFSLWDQRLRFFSNHPSRRTGTSPIDTEVYNAAQALFALFPPVQVEGDMLTTGATRDPTGLQAIWTHADELQLDAVLALDPVSASVWRSPTNVYDAFQLMLLNPIAALHELTSGYYAFAQAHSAAGSARPRLPPLYRIPVSIEPSYFPRMLEWTHGNALELDARGFAAAAPVADAVCRAPGERGVTGLEAALAPWAFGRVVDRVFVDAPASPPRSLSRPRQVCARLGALEPAGPARARKTPTAGRRASARTDGARRERIGLLVSGGAPTMHLAAGALGAFHDCGVEVSAIGTAGAGALPALLYAVPRYDRAKALRDTVNLNVHDQLYRLVTANYKVFFKHGPFSTLFRELARGFHVGLESAGGRDGGDHRYRNAVRRLYNDWVSLVTTVLTPSTLTPWATSVLQRVDVLDDLVAWERLPGWGGDFYLNAFDLGAQELRLFDKQSLTREAFYAALAMPWLYPPVAVDGRRYTEGASHDPSGLEALIDGGPAALGTVDAVIVLDTLGPDLWTDPEDIYEALELAIIDPIVTLSENVLAHYAWAEQRAAGTARPLPRLYRLPFDVPIWERGRVLEWSYSNALTLWDLGYRSGRRFCQRFFAKDPPGHPARRVAATPGRSDPRERYRYWRTVRPGSRGADFVKLFSAVRPSRAPR